MKKFLLGTVALVALGATVPALAADLPARSAPYTKAPAYVTPIYNWTGFYIGGHVGGAFAGDNSLSGSDGRFLGGIQGGADYQFGNNVVIGIEAEYSWLANGSTGVVFPAGTVVTTNSDQLGSVTGRLGYSFGPTLLYAKGGYAWKDNDNISVVAAGAPAAFSTDSNRKDGYTVGAGLEYMFAPSWSAKVEYMYYDFGRTNFVTPVVLSGFGSTRNDEHTVKAGINYHFNWGGPVVARY
jgi:outer membrane immunogenic protein